MEEKQEENERKTFKSRKGTRDALTMKDLDEAVNTINDFAAKFRKATMAIKNLERAEGGAGASAKGGGLGGMFGGGGGDPFTGMMMGAVEQAVQAQATKIVEKKTARMDLSDSAVDVTDAEMAEARGGLESEAEEGEEVEE